MFYNRFTASIASTERSHSSAESVITQQNNLYALTCSCYDSLHLIGGHILSFIYYNVI